MKNMPGEDSMSKHFESSPEGAAARYNSAIDMTLKVKQSKRKDSIAKPFRLIWCLSGFLYGFHVSSHVE